MFRFTDKRCSVFSAARYFADNAFETPRRVNQKTVIGVWKGRTLSGSFQLAGGTQKYVIECNANGEWSVATELMPA